jgi:DNA mismatch endonuclease (patch repair protein)
MSANGRVSPVSVPAHPGASSEGSSRRMRVARRRDTGPELALRRALHALGLRYRVAYPVPGQKRRTIDVAFTRARLAIFVDGCFWHGCPVHGTRPTANHSWWEAKLAANQSRDADTNRVLASCGWQVVRMWEHEDPIEVAKRIQLLLRDAGAAESPQDESR